jgi:hypothetical protein
VWLKEPDSFHEQKNVHLKYFEIAFEKISPQMTSCSLFFLAWIFWCKKTESMLWLRVWAILTNCRQQGCQMVYFQTKNPILDNIWSVLQWKMLVNFIEICRCVGYTLIVLHAFKSVYLEVWNIIYGRSWVFKIPPYTLEGFDRTTNSFSFLGGRRRRHHYQNQDLYKLSLFVLRWYG